MARPWRWLLICVLGTVVLTGATWLWMHHRARGSFEENRLVIEKLITELSATSIQRPVPGAPSDADALEIHEEVYRQVGLLSEREVEVIDQTVSPGWTPEEPITEAERLAVLERTRPMLDAMRPALNASRVGDRTRRRIGSDGYDISLIPERQSFSRLAELHTRHHLSRGEVDDALDIAVLQWQVFIDEARRATVIGYLVGVGVAGVGMESIRRTLATHDVVPARLKRLAHEIEVLETAFPGLPQTLAMEQIWIRDALAQPDFLDDDLSSGLASGLGMRFLFSEKLLAADALDQLSETYARLDEAVAGKTGMGAANAARLFTEKMEQDPNLLLRMIVATHAMVIDRGAQIRAHVELLRLTTALARYRDAHGSMPSALVDLVEAGFLSEIRPCPHSGAPFGYDGERVWSHGGDGDDDGGRPVPDGDFSGDGDVVYTLRLDELRAFPWPKDSEAAADIRFRQLLDLLHGGGEAGERARDELLELHPPPFAALISQFRAIDESIGLATKQGRARAGAIDRILRAKDAVMRVHWQQREPIGPSMSAEQARSIALRWVNWWFSGQRGREELDPEDVPDDLPEEGESEDTKSADKKPADAEAGR